METKLQLVPDLPQLGESDAREYDEEGETRSSASPLEMGVNARHPFVAPPSGAQGGRWARLLREERGAVTAEYAIVIMAAVAFAGLLVAILRSDEIRAMLVQLVEDALGAAG